MGHGRHVSGSSYPAPAPPPPVADYNVAANPALVPDCSCNYFLAGTYGGQPYYRRDDGLWFIWKDPDPGVWTISVQVGFGVGSYWEAVTGLIGDYEPQGFATGTATVSAGPH